MSGLVLLAALAALTMRSEQPDVVIESLPPCTATLDGASDPQVTVVVFDVSGSVIDSGGADPAGRSFEEGRLLAAALAEAPCSADDRMGAVIFASSPVEVPPIPLTSLSVIESALTRPPDGEIGGSTNLSAALDTVAEIAARYPDHTATAIVLSDMQPDDPARVASALEELDGLNLHLVALGEADQSFDWAFQSVTPLDQVRRGDIARALATAVSQTRTEG
jgi:uncharacterized protein (DUF58 family)